MQNLLIMHAWHHQNCVNLTIEEVKKYKTSEFWMCDYNDAFADIQF